MHSLLPPPFTPYKIPEQHFCFRVKNSYCTFLFIPLLNKISSDRGRAKAPHATQLARGGWQTGRAGQQVAWDPRPQRSPWSRKAAAARSHPTWLFSKMPCNSHLISIQQDLLCASAEIIMMDKTPNHSLNLMSGLKQTSEDNSQGWGEHRVGYWGLGWGISGKTFYKKEILKWRRKRN